MRARPVVSKIFCFDFDDTIFKTDIKVHVYNEDTGKFIKSLSNEEFNKYKKRPGHFLDFSEFVDSKLILKAKPYKAFYILKNLDNLIQSGKLYADIYVLTARTPHVQKAIFDLLKFHDIKNIIGSHIICMGDGRGEINIAEEKKKILKKWKKEYDEVYFFDDSQENITAANNLGVKTKLIEEYINKIKIR